jgi:hypothetical protein
LIVCPTRNRKADGVSL